jgi:Iap family predicted aminopeptidase
MKAQKTLFFSIVLMLGLVSCSSIKKDSSSLQTSALIKKALSDQTGYNIIESLTTEIGPRPAGSKQEEKARTWALNKMKTLGLKNIRVENFTVDHWERINEEAKIISPNPQALRVTALGGSVGTPKSGVTGDVVLFKNFKDLENASKDSLKNKIAFVDEPMTRTKDGSGYSVAVVKRRRTTIEAAKRGAVAALIRSVGTDHHRFPHTGQTGYEKGVKKIPIAALSAPDADQLRRSLSRGAVKLSLKINVRSKGKRVSGNVIGEIPGTTNKLVLAGAHLDSWDLGTGAVDDGAGVGIVLGAAKIILDQNIKPKHTIRIVLFGSEEVGLIGAKAYAKKHSDDLKNHLVAAESDFGAGEIWKLDTKFYKQALPLARKIQKSLKSIGVSKGNNEAYGGPDLIPMRDLGVPVVTLKQNGWDYFDLHHTEDDTFDKIKPENIAQNVAAYSVFLWMTSNSSVEFRQSSLDKK